MYSLAFKELELKGKLSNTKVQEIIKNLVVITGGARSGKSKFAERLAQESGESVVYIATMEQLETDTESCHRISRHRERRPAHWHTIEQPYNVNEVVDELEPGTRTCILDCLSLYVSNIVLLDYAGDAIDMDRLEEHVLSSVNDLIDSIARQSGTNFFVVTNEVGWGIVPENGLARAYRDLLGVANQVLAGAASEVWMCCSGLQLKLKPSARAPVA